MVHLIGLDGWPISTQQHKKIAATPYFDFVVLLAEIDPARQPKWGEPVIITPHEANLLVNGLLPPVRTEINTLVFKLFVDFITIPFREYRDNIVMKTRWSLFPSRSMTFLVSEPINLLTPFPVDGDDQELVVGSDPDDMGD
ncbi:hypothetical protein GYA13_02095 [Candidatus Kuenenbacteria bacterium]|nr:hypothetical protein [Candidatus Kuenenbacteria bacterium]